ncbi:hypothetical protein [Oleomonas cavernae]|nr:hypothetical protein [Oleomonas cavernae]
MRRGIVRRGAGSAAIAFAVPGRKSPAVLRVWGRRTAIASAATPASTGSR